MRNSSPLSVRYNTEERDLPPRITLTSHLQHTHTHRGCWGLTVSLLNCFSRPRCTLWREGGRWAAGLKRARLRPGRRVTHLHHTSESIPDVWPRTASPPHDWGNNTQHTWTFAPNTRLTHGNFCTRDKHVIISIRNRNVPLCWNIILMFTLKYDIDII